jgi:putative peptidoglycan lipid II flippase
MDVASASARPGPTHGESARPGGAARLARSAGVIGLATMSSRLLGLVRDQVLAYVFAASHDMDAYLVAFRIPNLLRDLFAEGAMSAAFVPTFTRLLTLEGKPAAWRLGNLVVNALLLVTGTLVLVGIAFASPIARFAAPRYAEVPGQLALVVTLARLMFPFLTLVALAAACMGMLNSLRRFFVPSLSPAMFNVGMIATMGVMIPLLSARGVRPIFAAAIGTLVGGIGQVAVQWALLRREGYRYRPAVAFGDPAVREVIGLMVPGMVGLAAVQVNVLVNTMLATGQGVGAVSYLNYAFRLMYFPIGLFGLSIATAAVPALSRHAALDDRAAMRATLSSALRMMLMLNVPATVGLVVLATPIVALIFEHGHFTPRDTAGTVAALLAYAPGLVGYSAVKITVPTFYTLRDSRTPVLVSGVTVGLNLALNLVLVRWLGYQGLALGTAIAALVNAAVLLWLLRARLDGIDGRRLAVALLKILAASAAMAAAVWSVEGWLARTVPGPALMPRAVHVAASIGVGVGVLATTARALRISEFQEAVRTVAARLRGSRTNS